MFGDFIFYNVSLSMVSSLFNFLHIINIPFQHELLQKKYDLNASSYYFKDVFA